MTCQMEIKVWDELQGAGTVGWRSRNRRSCREILWDSERLQGFAENLVISENESTAQMQCREQHLQY